MKNLEKVIEEVSGKGNYQALITCFVMTVSIPAAFMNTGSVFLAAVPDSRCVIAEIENFTTRSNLSEAAIKANFLPWNHLGNRHDRCKRFQYNITQCIGDDLLNCVGQIKNNSIPSIVPCDNDYLFDHSTFQSTIVTEWNLICGQISLASASTSFYYIGMFFGSILGGILSDRFGRLLIYRCGAILSLVSGVAIGFAPNIYVFAFLRCMVAISSCAAAKVAVVYVVEICNERWRSFAGLSYTIGFGLGCMLLSVFAYFIRDWRTLEIAISSTFAVCVVVSFCVDKSPRWVYVQGDSREAETICRHIARRNGIVVSDEVWDQFEGVKEDESKEKKVESKNTLKEMLIRPFTRLMLLNNMFVWMTTSLVYYGLTLNSGALAGNIFINNAAGGLMELMAALVSGPAIAKFGCRNSVIFYEFLASFSCLVSTIAIQFANSNKAVETLGVVLAMIGRFGISAAWAVMYLHTPALFATPGRSSALGASSMASRVGSIITPFTLQLQYNIPWLTQTVFGIGAFIVACLCTLYPETHGRPMMSSYDEAEMRFKRHVTQTRLYRIVCCFRSRPIEEDYNAREFETMEKVA